MAKLRELAGRSIDILSAVAAVAAAVVPDESESLRSLVPSLRARLEIGGSAAASNIHRLRLALTRGQCLALVELGITDETTLTAALASRRSEVEAALSTPVVNDIEQRLASVAERSRRRTATSADVLDLFGGPSAL